MTVKSGQVWTGNFDVRDATGALAVPSVGPIGTLYVAGVATADVVTISGGAPYKWSVTLPALTAGQTVGMRITATVSLIATAAVVAEDVADTEFVSDLTDEVIGTGAGLTALGDARLANLDAAVSSRGTADPGDEMTLTAAYDAAKTAAQAGDEMDLVDAPNSTAVTAIQDGLAVPGDAMTLADDAITSATFDETTAWPIKAADTGSTYIARTGADSDTLETLSDQIDGVATPDDVTVSLAVSATEAAAISSGQIALTLWHTLSQSVTSTSTADLEAATKLWLGIKANPRADTDAESLVYIEATAGLQYLAGAAYTGSAANGSLTVSGEAGDWDILIELQETVTGNLSAWGGEVVDAQVKALVGGDTVNVWSGTCRIGYEVVRAVA
ncbi:MAG: hypothetical protein WC683_12655 [bacterium]